MTESKIMKTISEMSQDEKTELLKTIEENRINIICFVINFFIIHHRFCLYLFLLILINTYL